MSSILRMRLISEKIIRSVSVVFVFPFIEIRLVRRLRNPEKSAPIARIRSGVVALINVEPKKILMKTPGNVIISAQSGKLIISIHLNTCFDSVFLNNRKNAGRRC